MTEKEIEIIEQAVAILDKEGYGNSYDGEVSRIFWEAVRWIKKAMERRIET